MIQRRTLPQEKEKEETLMDVIETGLPGLFENSESEVKEEFSEGNCPPKNSTQLAKTPLPHKMRPKKIEDFEGIDGLLKKYPILLGGSLPSLVLWGPPGCGAFRLRANHRLRHRPGRRAGSSTARVRPRRAASENKQKHKGQKKTTK